MKFNGVVNETVELKISIYQFPDIVDGGWLFLLQRYLRSEVKN
jgi:hypothetical protein